MVCANRQLSQAQREDGYDQQRTGVRQALRPFSGPQTIENLVDYINRELGPALRAARQKVNDVYLQVTDNAPSANPLGYYFSSTTAAADPMAGRLRLNQATQNTATIIRVSESNAQLQSVQPWLDVMSGGPTTPLGTVTLTDAVNPSRFLRFDLNTMTDQGTYWDLGVTLIESSSANPFVDDEGVTVGFIAGVSAAGSTVPVGSLSPVARDTFLGNITTGTTAPTAVPLASIDSTSIVYDGTAHEMQRAALTGEATAAQNVNALTVTRSTNFQTSPWTGDHQFNAEVRLGTLHTESSVSGALNITLTAGATRVLITSTADVTLGTISGCAEGRILEVEHVRASGTGNLIVTHSSSSANAISCPGNRTFVLGDRGGFELVGRGSPAVWKILQKDIYAGDTLTESGGGTFNDYALPDDVKVLAVGADATFTGFARTSGNVDGDRFWVRTNDGINVTLKFNSGSSTAGNKISSPETLDFSMSGRCMVELRMESSSWRVIESNTGRGRLLAYTEYLTGSGTHTYNLNTRFAVHDLTSGGGAGGGTIGGAGASAGGGGQAGATRRTAITVTPGSAVSYSVGAGGSGVAGADGGAGSGTTMDACTTPVGGGGGRVGTNATTNNVALGGGDNATGSQGAAGESGFAVVEGGTDISCPGKGGDGPDGGGGWANPQSSTAAGVGAVGRLPGAGGAGSHNVGTAGNRAGGGGAAGRIRVWEFS